jgi:tripartite-type tricarboxylate transporter receptor subunit TctC
VDLAFRLVARELEKFLGQPVVVLNRPGGGGSIAVAALASAKPDGYTIGHVPGQTIFVMPYLEKLQYNPAKDLAFIAQFAEANFALVVRRDSPIASVKDLVAAARRNPDKLTYGTNAATGVANLVVEQIGKRENVRFTNVPFKGSPEAQAALLGEHIAFAAGEFNASMIDNGQFRILALFGDKPRAAFPQVPTLKEVGYDIPSPVFQVLAGPKGMPEAIVRKIDEAVAKAVRDPRFLKGAQELRIPVVYRDHRELSEYVARNYEYFGRLLAEMGLAK